MRSSRRASLVASLVALLPGCGGPRETDGGVDPRDLVEKRRAMVAEIRERGVRDERVLEAMMAVPRERFVPPEQREAAYHDGPLPIGQRQTISQPYIVAFMTEALELQPGDRVLEVGTGSGYQAAVLAQVGVEVFSIEILSQLADRAREALVGAGYDDVHLRVGDGYRGWPEAAPFDAIIVTAAPDHVPDPLIEQLAPGGCLVMPVGDRHQTLIRLRKAASGELSREELLPVRFVPMTGEARK